MLGIFTSNAGGKEAAEGGQQQLRVVDGAGGHDSYSSG